MPSCISIVKKHPMYLVSPIDHLFFFTTIYIVVEVINELYHEDSLTVIHIEIEGPQKELMVVYICLIFVRLLLTTILEIIRSMVIARGYLDKVDSVIYVFVPRYIMTIIITFFLVVSYIKLNLDELVYKRVLSFLFLHELVVFIIISFILYSSRDRG